MTKWLKRILLEWLFDGLEPRQYGDFVMWTRAYDHPPWRDYWCPACGRKLTEVWHECKSCQVSYDVGLAKSDRPSSNLAVSEHATRMQP